MSGYIISIRDRHRQQKRRRKTLALPSKRGDQLGRRRLGGFHIRFFDLGRLADGSTVPLLYTPTISSITSTTGGLISDPTVGDITSNDGAITIILGVDGSAGFVVDLTDTDYSSYWNTVALALTLDDLETDYWQITDADESDYGLQHSGHGGYEPDGFKVTTDEIGGEIYSYNSRMSMSFSSLGESGDPALGSIESSTVAKVTLTPDYSADAVELRLTSDLDVFLAPKFQLWYGACSGGGTPPDFDPATYNGTGSLNAEHWFLNGIFKPIPREVLGTTNWDAVLASVPTDSNLSNLKNALNSTLRQYWKDLHTLDSDSTQLWWAEEGGGFPFTPTPTPVAASLFPTSSYSYPTVGARHAAAAVYASARFPAGALIALIHKGSDWYYVWNTADRDLCNNFFRLGAIV